MLAARSDVAAVAVARAVVVDAAVVDYDGFGTQQAKSKNLLGAIFAFIQTITYQDGSRQT